MWLYWLQQIANMKMPEKNNDLWIHLWLVRGFLLCFFSMKYIFFYLGLVSRTFMIHRTARKEQGTYLTHFYHFHRLQRYLDVNRTIIAESSPLHIVSIQFRTRNPRFPSASPSSVTLICNEYVQKSSLRLIRETFACVFLLKKVHQILFLWRII